MVVSPAPRLVKFLKTFFGKVHQLMIPQTLGKSSSLGVTPPKFNIAPESDLPNRKGSSSNHHFSGAMLNFRGVYSHILQMGGVYPPTKQGF